MARIDCSVTVNYAREYSRMCKREECNECPASLANNGTDYDCERLLYSYPEVAVEIVQAWSDEHPVKTRLDELLEKNPNITLNDVGKVPYIKPYHFGYCKNCAVCPLRAKASVSLTHCWREPVDGGATGKAVE